MELASWHLFGAQKFDVAARFFRTFCNPEAHCHFKTSLLVSLNYSQGIDPGFLIHIF
jgi:hypothetical protein